MLAAKEKAEQATWASQKAAFKRKLQARRKVMRSNSAAGAAPRGSVSAAAHAARRASAVRRASRAMPRPSVAQQLQVASRAQAFAHRGAAGAAAARAQAGAEQQQAQAQAGAQAEPQAQAQAAAPRMDPAIVAAAQEAVRLDHAKEYKAAAAQYDRVVAMLEATGDARFAQHIRGYLRRADKLRDALCAAAPASWTPQQPSGSRRKGASKAKANHRSQRRRASRLPPSWAERSDLDGNVYFVNQKTGETRSTRPSKKHAAAGSKRKAAARKNRGSVASTTSTSSTHKVRVFA